MERCNASDASSVVVKGLRGEPQDGEVMQTQSKTMKVNPCALEGFAANAADCCLGLRMALGQQAHIQQCLERAGLIRVSLETLQLAEAEVLAPRLEVV